MIILLLLVSIFSYQDNNIKTMQHKLHLNTSDCILDENFTDQIYRNTSICIINCKFDSIQSNTLNGGAVFINISSNIKETNIITNCTFSNCIGLNGGSIYISTQIKNTFNFTNCHFCENSAQTDGGSISINQVNSEFFNCSFIMNRAAYGTTKYGRGGSIFIQNSQNAFKNCFFSLNSVDSATASSANGGALFMETSEADVSDCLFESNFIMSTSKSARSCGGAVYCYTSNCTFYNCSMKNNSLISNSSSFEFYFGYGAAMYMMYTSCSIIDCCFVCNFVANASKTLGGAAFTSMKTVNFSRCLFEGNLIVGSNEVFGGASYLHSTTSLFDSCSFINNTALNVDTKIKSCGGFVYVGSSYVVFDKCIFADNKAERGGSIYYAIGTESYVSIANSAIEHNFDECDVNISSVVFFYHEKSNTIVHTFRNNSVFLRNPKDVVVFDASLSTGIRFKWNFTDNCLWPYKEDLFKTPNINLFDPSGLGMISLSYAFKNKCSFSSSTFEFTYSNTFSQSSLYSSFNSQLQTITTKPTEASSMQITPIISDTQLASVSQAPNTSNEHSFTYTHSSGNSDSSSKKSFQLLPIIMISIGVVLIILLIVLFIVLKKRSSSKKQNEISQSILLETSSLL